MTGSGITTENGAGSNVKKVLPSHGKTVLTQLLEDGKIIIVKLNRPEKLNTMNDEMQRELERLFDFIENEPSIWVTIITGNSLEPFSDHKIKSFCAGQDLQEWLTQTAVDQRERLLNNPNGFGSLSRRRLSKPVIAAVDGLCLGGGLELLLNCDLVVATQKSIFGFPEVSRGVIAVQGGIPRLTHLCGRTLASELLLTGRSITTREAYERFRIINKVVKRSDELIPAALELGGMIIKNSPTAVQLSKLSILDTHLRYQKTLLKRDREVELKSLKRRFGGGIEDSTLSIILGDEFDKVFRGDDFLEGLTSFSEKRPPIWSNPAIRIFEREEGFNKKNGSFKL
ncbi:ClpP/crotonase-like domain-containing protein [Phakopsora pachyrhizi]|uniref:ClpP/crotonase-like domain-containing protein n=1 Tax=Phakopsora pachyrhizi TaxID=170000 RepID=A0AAV0AKJ2_PHAPC|nr:ClpP/crotonase-like domain-containing protein [Phakopsora pachyrhizi]CAH7668611.1 ClpP/crotonase-like domain-containing protein [Phakopsora pachyrhizi]